MFISATLATQGEFGVAAAGFKDYGHDVQACDIACSIMSPLAQALAASPDLFPAALDPRTGLVTLWRLTSADYSHAAFLDGRIAVGKQSRQVSFAELATAVETTKLTETCDFIFHIGHVGSTLLSRLLGRHPALLSVREPDVLRTLSTIGEKLRRDAYMPTFLRLLSRTYDPQARPLVKTTSFVSEIASELLARPYEPRALAMGVAPEIYLATIFGGENAPAEARALKSMRTARLRARLSDEPRLENRTEGATVALGWACESLCLADAAGSAGTRVLVLDFEKFVADLGETLARAFAHFHVRTADSEVAAILAGDEMRTYSKAPEYAYDGETRRAVLAQGRARHASEIREGLRWLEAVAADHPPLAAALSLFN